jgi:hypothetical protein
MGGLRQRKTPRRARSASRETREPNYKATWRLKSKLAPAYPIHRLRDSGTRARLADGGAAADRRGDTDEADDRTLLLDVAADAKRSRPARLGARPTVRDTRRAVTATTCPRSPVVGEASPLAPRIDWDLTDDAIDGKPGVEAHGCSARPTRARPATCTAG